MKSEALQRQRFSDEEVLGELLAFHSTAAGCDDSEIRIQKTRNCLIETDND